MLNTDPSGSSQVLSFRLFTLRVPLAPAAQLLRARGGEETELTLAELAKQGLGRAPTALPRAALLAELYSRLARSLALPLMPLLAIPFGLTAKRAGSTPAIAIAGVLLFGFQSGLIVLQGVAAKGHLSAEVAIGGPTAVFAVACVAAFATSRKRPGQNPVYRLAERLADAIAMLTPRNRDPDARARPEKRGLPR
jgi:lipopolysaccharide export system permease protein